jgi:hypothetical protein
MSLSPRITAVFAALVGLAAQQSPTFVVALNVSVAQTRSQTNSRNLKDTDSQLNNDIKDTDTPSIKPGFYKAIKTKPGQGSDSLGIDNNYNESAAPNPIDDGALFEDPKHCEGGVCRMISLKNADWTQSQGYIGAHEHLHPNAENFVVMGGNSPDPTKWWTV